MGLTVNINGITLCHEKSKGTVSSTVPDVCLTPPQNIPIPYLNTAKSKHLKKGTKSVRADGGAKCAVRGSKFSKSKGDEAGKTGGIISKKTKSKATWLTFSPNVFFEGKAVCRLTDKMLLNSMNTVSIGGLKQEALKKAKGEFRKGLDHLCDLAQGSRCKKDDGIYPQRSLDKKVKNQDFDNDEDAIRVGNEISYSTKSPYDKVRHGAKGSVRPDHEIRDKNGKLIGLAEVKFCSDRPRPSQKKLKAIAKKHKLSFTFLYPCDDCDGDPDEENCNLREKHSRSPSRQKAQEEAEFYSVMAK